MMASILDSDRIENVRELKIRKKRMTHPVFNLAHTCQNIQYVECGQYKEEEEEKH
jgi:hypothetical protein